MFYEPIWLYVGIYNYYFLVENGVMLFVIISKVAGVNHNIKFPRTPGFLPSLPYVRARAGDPPSGSGQGVISPVRSEGLHTTIAMLPIFLFSSSYPL